MLYSILTAMMFSVLNMNRGAALVPHWAFWILTGVFIQWNVGDIQATACWGTVFIIVIAQATKPLLAGINGDPSAIKNGAIRNILVLPAAVFLHNWGIPFLLLQGLVYYLCGKWKNRWATRLAEGITGFYLGALL